MAGHTGVLSLLRALGKVSKRHVQSFGSIGGQNFLLFVAVLALQPESVGFFGLVLVAVLLIPLSSDPMRVIPEDRRVTWPIGPRGWVAVQIGSLFLNPIAWIGIALVVAAGWKVGVLALATGIAIERTANLAKRGLGLPGGWLRWVPAPPGAFGSIMRLHWRGMLRTLDPYLALALAAPMIAYRFSGSPLDAAAPRIMALVTALVLSTQTQLLFSMDGSGSDRYLLMPIRGWRILLAKDVAFLAMLAILVWPLDVLGGLLGGVASLTIGHHVSVTRFIPQVPWRFTAGVLFPWGLFQTIVLFAVGSSLPTVGMPMVAACLLAWAGSVWFYGWLWDRRRVER